MSLTLMMSLRLKAKSVKTAAKTSSPAVKPTSAGLDDDLFSMGGD